MADVVLVDVLETGIVKVVLNRPERRNALSIKLLEMLCGEIDRLASDSANRVAIVCGAGPVFSSGLDLREAADVSLIECPAQAIAGTLARVRGTAIATIAAVQGGAFAGGAGLMAACDIVVASADAQFGFPEVRRGLLPALICDVLLQRVRPGDLRELLLTGEPIDAARACQVGLVQRVVPSERLQDEALGIARSIVAGGPVAVRKTKDLINRMCGGAKHSTQNLVDTHLAARHSPEAREGLSAFVEKREPKW